MSQAQIISAAEFEQAGLVAPDVYFRPGYGLAEQVHGQGEWIAVVAHDGDWQIPLHLRESPLGRDALSPYGYAGIHAGSGLGHAEREEAWRSTIDVLTDLGVLALFLRQSPMLPAPFRDFPGHIVVANHPTVLVPTKDPEQVWHGMEGRCRTSVRRAEREGFATTVDAIDLDSLLEGGNFRALYDSAMSRRGARARYVFGDNYYRTLIAGLGDDLQLAVTRDESGEVVAAGIFMRHGSTLHYHLSGSSPEAGKLGASNQLIWTAIQWAAEHGVERLHLGGGVLAADGLFAFKRSFGGDVLSFSAHGVVLDAARYAAAVQRRADELGRPTESLIHSSFFPAFRVSA